jgi:hypothetical protein
LEGETRINIPRDNSALHHERIQYDETKLYGSVYVLFSTFRAHLSCECVCQGINEQFGKEVS